MFGHKITHVRKKSPATSCSCITKVKLGKGQKLNVEDVIKMMQGSYGDKVHHQFYVVAAGQTISVKAVPEDSPKYIRTEKNDSPYDTLLNLPKF